MNLSPLWRLLFEAEGIEATHWSTVGDPRAKDTEIFEWARSNGYVVFAHDLDFSRLLALSGAAGPSVVHVRAHGILPADIGQLVVSALREHQDLLERGAIVVVEPSASRVRLLPLARGTER